MVLPLVSVLRRCVVMPRGWHQTPSGWWQRSIKGPRPPIREMVSCTIPATESAWEVACMAEQVRTAAAQSPTVATTQPRAGVSCCRRHCRCLTVGECNCGVGGGQPSCQATVGCFTGCKNASNRSPDSRQDQGVQGVPRPCQEARVPGRGSHCQSCRTEDDFRWGGCGRRKRLQELLEEEVNAPVPVPLPRVADLQQQIDDLVRERELLRAFQTRIPREGIFKDVRFYPY